LDIPTPTVGFSSPEVKLPKPAGRPASGGIEARYQRRVHRLRRNRLGRRLTPRRGAG
jgi:hypothetical protein